jgi:sensor domain CHASE-containing protein
MIAVGVILVLVGFAMLASRGSVPGATAARNVRMGPQMFSTRGHEGEQSTRYRVIQIAMGLVVLVGGIVIIAVSS